MDSREVVAAIVGGTVHAYALTNPEDKSAMDNFVVGAAGGALGGLLLVYYMPYSGMPYAVAAGIAGMLAFDYFLFRV